MTYVDLDGKRWPTIAGVRRLESLCRNGSAEEYHCERSVIIEVLKAYTEIVDMAQKKRGPVCGAIQRGARVPLKGMEATP